MAVTAASFRTDFPEFANATHYPEAQVNFWLTLGRKLMDTVRWGDFIDQGLELFVAHNLAIGRPAARSAATGAAPGLSAGPVASKQVDKVSVSYDTAAAMTPGAGHWNLTIYGQRYIQLVNLVGMGGVQF